MLAPTTVSLDGRKWTNPVGLVCEDGRTAWVYDFGVKRPANARMEDADEDDTLLVRHNYAACMQVCNRLLFVRASVVHGMCIYTVYVLRRSGDGYMRKSCWPCLQEAMERCLGARTSTRAFVRCALTHPDVQRRFKHAKPPCARLLSFEEDVADPVCGS